MQTKMMAIAAGAFVLGAIAGFACSRLMRGKCKCGNDHRGGARKCGDNGRQNGKQGVKRHLPPADGSIEIYVGNISYDLTEDQLRKEFEAFGKVNSARIITNSFNGRSKGFGFVHMPDKAEVEAALAALNDKEILGRKLRCNGAKND